MKRRRSGISLKAGIRKRCANDCGKPWKNS